MKLGINVDVKALSERLKLTEKSIAFAVVNAVNDTAKATQALARENVEQKFTLRKREFVLRQAAIIRPFASVKQGRPFAELSVGTPARMLLSTFEAGGEKRPFVGKRVAVPITGSAARPSFGDSVPSTFRIAQLRMRQQKAKPRGTQGVESAPGMSGVWRGKNRTYLVPGVGIFQRTGAGKGNTEMLYLFDDQVNLPKRLGFLSLAQRKARPIMNENLERQLIKEIQRAARKRGPA